MHGVTMKFTKSEDSRTSLRAVYMVTPSKRWCCCVCWLRSATYQHEIQHKQFYQYFIF